MDVVTVGGETFSVKRAERGDVPALVKLLRDDQLGAQRESDDCAAYDKAFEQIEADPNQFLAVIRDSAGSVCGTFQLTLIPGLARGGAKRLQIEAVRLDSATRNRGLGTALFEWVHAYGRLNGAHLAQLTTDKRRADAHRFYAALGYMPTHEGFKRAL